MILKNYNEGISDLKKYDVHPVLRKDGKQTLMDFYYDEAQMNKWRDSCIRGQESLKNKVERFEKEIQSVKAKSITQITSSQGDLVDEVKVKEVNKRLQNNISEKEPLIISILSTVFEDLKEMHRHLAVFCAPEPKADDVRAAQLYFINIEGLKQKMRGHQELSA